MVDDDNREITGGSRDSDGLTASERSLIAELRRQGIEIRHGFLVDERRGSVYPHGRVIEMERRP